MNGPHGSLELDEDAAIERAALPTATVGDKELEIKLVFRTRSVFEIEHLNFAGKSCRNHFSRARATGNGGKFGWYRSNG